jgi:hypothetical protein|tara:strand:+ start:414 stop:1331 length:918 start_codon:yes stop_codon:yes gene_type:complete
MAFGQIYCTTDFGDASNIQTIPHFPDCSGFSNRKSVFFDGLTPGESISVLDLPFQFIQVQGMVIMAWVKFAPEMETDTSYDQRCIVDYSENIFTTADARGYSIFVRKTTAGNITMNFYYRNNGFNRVNCSAILNLNNYNLSQPMLVVASLRYESAGNNSIQNLRVYQSGVGAPGDNYVEVTRSNNAAGTRFPVNQDLCFGNTNNAGQTSQEFRGNIDEVVIYNGSNIGSSYAQLADSYYGTNNAHNLDVSTLQFYNQVVGWYRFGDNYFLESTFLKFPNASNGSGATATGDSSLTSSKIVGPIVT